MENERPENGCSLYGSLLILQFTDQNTSNSRQIHNFNNSISKCLSGHVYKINVSNLKCNSTVFSQARGTDVYVNLDSMSTS